MTREAMYAAVERIRRELEEASEGRYPAPRLMAVTKTRTPEEILPLKDMGITEIGENRVQELKTKLPELGGAFRVHLIGRLQRNKVKQVIGNVCMIQSVDSLHLLDAIQDWGKANGKVISVLLELHIGAEQTKQGFHEEEVLDILFRADKYTHVRFCGLMGMASHTDDEDDIRADFARIADFKAYLDDLFPELTDFRELSIGMSGDWPVALDYGATIVRIGTAIFGERQY